MRSHGERRTATKSSSMTRDAIESQATQAVDHRGGQLNEVPDAAASVQRPRSPN
jgi:hypothetical protein